LAFQPNEEISGICWWDPRDVLPGRSPLDAYLARLTRDDDCSKAG
jgi:hypothetical protein